jgi:hypothetical protein
MNKKIYIAGPYTSPDQCINTNKALRVGDKVIEQGDIPFVPHLFHFWHTVSPKEYDTWMKIDIEFLKVCDEMWVISGESKGVKIEIEIAESLGKKVVYLIED